MTEQLQNLTEAEWDVNDTSLPLEFFWYLCATMSSTMSVISLYLLIRVFVFVKSRLQNNATSLSRCSTYSGPREQRRNTFRSVSSDTEGQVQNNSSQLNFGHWKKDPGKMMYTILLVAFFLNFLRGLEEQVLVFAGNYSDIACNVLSKVMVVLTALTLHFCHIFLWCRQASFYNNPLLKHLRSRKLRIVSTSAYILMLLTLLSSLFLHLWWRDYKRTTFGCFARTELDKLKPHVPFIFLAASTATIQLTMTGLFVYPIVTHNRQMGQMSRVNSTNGRTKSKQAERLLRCVKRALFSGTLGIGTDAVGAFLAIWLPENLPTAVISVTYELNLLLNLICLLYTYNSWIRILTPVCRKERS